MNLLEHIYYFLLDKLTELLEKSNFSDYQIQRELMKKSETAEENQDEQGRGKRDLNYQKNIK